VRALGARRRRGYALLGLSGALGLLGHVQMAYSVGHAAGLFALYLTLEEASGGGEPAAPRVGRLALALGAVLLGFGLAMIQVLPCIHYIPFSPRAQGYYGFAGATSYAIPSNHVREFVV